MALIVEDGTGIRLADAYISQADATTYWGDRPHDPNSALWVNATSDNKNGAIVEATAFLDAKYNKHYKGVKAGSIQGREFPRTGSEDADGMPLPAMPKELTWATAELAVRALSARLSPDVETPGVIKSFEETMGPMGEKTTYENGSRQQEKFGFVELMLQPILKSSINGNPPQWNWK